MAEWVLDSSAVLAWLMLEPGAEVVEPALPGSLISSVNVAEVVSRLVDLGRTDAQAIGSVSLSEFSVVDFDQDLAFRAGGLRRVTRQVGLSLGDRACLALAEREGLPVLTADRAWAALDIGVEIRLIR